MKERIQLQKGDITKLAVDAIVNAANTSLMGGGGVDGAIHRAGGKEILEDCRKIIARMGSCKVGNAVITTAGKLPSKYVIHTVGPVWNNGKYNEEEKLANCYRNALLVAREHNCKTVAFPNISTGIYHFPKDKAAEIAINTTKEFLLIHPVPEVVIFISFDEENYNIYQQLL